MEAQREEHSLLLPSASDPVEEPRNEGFEGDRELSVTKVAGFAEAAAIVTDALSQRDTNYAPDETALWARRIYFSSPWTSACVVAVLLNLALVLVESPNREAEAAMAYARGRGGGGGKLANSTIPLLPLGPGDLLSLVFELCCTLVYAADTALQFLYLGRDAFFHSKWVCLKLVLVPLVILANGGESMSLVKIEVALLPSPGLRLGDLRLRCVRC